MTEKHESFDDTTPETAADQAEASAEAYCVPVPEDIAALRAMVARLEDELAEAKNNYLRAHADFDNFRKRLRAERDAEFGRGSDHVLAALLPVVDDFERALAAITEHSAVDSLREGVELIYRHLLRLLERYHITPMEVEGKPFDPKYHDAVAVVPTDAAPEHTIIGQVLRGYLKQTETFRPAKVAVAVAPEGQGDA